MRDELVNGRRASDRMSHVGLRGAPVCVTVACIYAGSRIFRRFRGDESP